MRGGNRGRGGPNRRGKRGGRSQDPRRGNGSNNTIEAPIQAPIPTIKNIAVNIDTPTIDTPIPTEEDELVFLNKFASISTSGDEIMMNAADINTEGEFNV